MSCPECFKGAVHDHGTAQGKMETLYGFPTYVASPPSTSTSKSAILFLTDAFGLNLINNKLLADRYAAETGCKVLVPDLIPGGPCSVKTLSAMDGIYAPVAWYNVFGQLSRVWSGLTAASHLIPFMMRANVEKAYPDELRVARAMKQALPPGGKLGVAGFCWGGYGSTKLCTEPAEEGGSTPLIDAQYNAHPSQLKTPDMFLDAVKAKVPFSMAIGDNDMVLGVDKVHEAEAALRAKVGEPAANHYEVRIYKGCRHGFAARASPANKVEMEASDEAAKQAIAWFNKYLN